TAPTPASRDDMVVDERHTVRSGGFPVLCSHNDLGSPPPTFAAAHATSHILHGINHLAVVSREVGYAAGGWAADAGVVSVIVVLVQEVGEGGVPFGLLGVRLDVGPFVEGGA